ASDSCLAPDMDALKRIGRPPSRFVGGLHLRFAMSLVERPRNPPMRISHELSVLPMDWCRAAFVPVHPLPLHGAMAVLRGDAGALGRLMLGPLAGRSQRRATSTP